jgi:hypothetical protein
MGKEMRKVEWLAGSLLLARIIADEPLEGAAARVGGHCHPGHRLASVSVGAPAVRRHTRALGTRPWAPCATGIRAPRTFESVEPTGARRDSERSSRA